MLFSTLGQQRVFLWMLVSGMLIGAWYGCLACLRRLLAAGVWLSLMCDLLFGLGAGAIFCAALVTANYGALRLYAVAAALMGFMVFAMGVYPPGRRAIHVIKCTSAHIFVKIRRFRWINVIFK